MTDISDTTIIDNVNPPDTDEQAAPVTIEQGDGEVLISDASEDPVDQDVAAPNAPSPRKAIFDASMFRLLTFAWTGIVAALSLSPITPSAIHQIGDKAEHFLAYALLSFLTIRGWTGSRFLYPAFMVILVFGALMEGLQWYIPGRSVEGLDFAANILGAFAGLIFAALWLMGKPKP